jgi:hypothetical protein
MVRPLESTVENPAPTPVDVAPRSLAVSARRLFREELSDDALLLLVLDAREQLCPQLSNCFWFIERQLLIHLAALKVTGLAAGLEYRPDVRSKGGPFYHCLARGGGLIHGGAGFR